SINMPGRVGSAQGVTLNAGTLNYIANPGQGVAPLATTAKIGTVTLGAGQSTIQAGFGVTPALGTTSVLTIAALARAGGGTVNFVANAGGGSNAGLDSGNNRIAFTSVPTLSGSNGGVLPYAIVAGADFATYDTVNNSVTPYTGYATSLAAAGSN